MSSKFMHDDDIASALNDGDSSELESLTSEAFLPVVRTLQQTAC